MHWRISPDAAKKRLRAAIEHERAQLASDTCHRLLDVLPQSGLDQLIAAYAGGYRQRLFAPGVTLGLFVDQTLELAKPLAHALGIPLLDDVLVRVRETAPQSRLDAPARRRNLRRAFAVRPDATLPAHVMMIDDVMTAGATLHAAADALLRAGVTRA